MADRPQAGQTTHSHNENRNEEAGMSKERRVALVTGGMGGLGEAICIKLAALGDDVITTYSPGNTKAQVWLDGMKTAGYAFRAYPCDVADFDSAAAGVAKITADVGAIDILVNNAGITRDVTVRKIDEADRDAVMATNHASCFNIARRGCNGMGDRGGGRIVNISAVN